MHTEIEKVFLIKPKGSDDPLCVTDPFQKLIRGLIGLWCNGNTTVFGAVFLGSTPSNPTIGYVVKWLSYWSVTPELGVQVPHILLSHKCSNRQKSTKHSGVSGKLEG